VQTGIKAERWLRYFIILLSLVACIDNIIKGDWVSVASAGLTVVFLLLPPLLEKLLRITLPVSFKWIYLAFVFASMYLGETHSFFYRIPCWDIILHTASAMLLAYLAWILIFVLNHDKNIDRKLSPFFMALFVFCAPVALGGVWELFEYAADKVFGVNMIKAIAPNDLTRFYDYQRGFLNSLHDMVMDSGGALVIAVCTYIHYKTQGRFSRAFGILKRQFNEANPSLFDKSDEAMDGVVLPD
jgi:hypothetical protein